MTATMLRTLPKKSALRHKKFDIFLDQRSPARKFRISIIQTLNFSLHCNYPKLSCSAEVNKEELLIRILQ